MKNLLLFVGILFISANYYGQNLVEITQNDVIDVKKSSMATKDINGDGKPDLYISGINNSGNVVNAFYTNNGYGTFLTDNSHITNVAALSSGSAQFYNDWLLIAGANSSDMGTVKLYEYDGTTFIETANVFQGITKGKAEFIDFDGDGDMDIYISGEDAAVAIAKFYQNDGAGNFTNVSFPNITPLKQGAFVFGDFGGSGNETDLFMTGIKPANGDTVTQIYAYQINNYVLINDSLMGFADARIKTHYFSSTTRKDVIINGIQEVSNAQYIVAYLFTDTGTVAQTVLAQHYTNGDFVISDFDMDSKDDIVLTGKKLSDQSLKSQLLLADTSSNVLGFDFTNDTTTSLKSLFDGQALSFDFENDGDIDLIISGTNDNGEGDTRLYRNINICQSSTGIDVRDACDSLVWLDGIKYTSSNNTAVFNMKNSNIWGCDSIITLNLSIKQKSYLNDNRGVVCDSLTWINGQKITQSTSGLEYIVGQNAVGCDSIAILDVTIKHSSFLDYNIAECNEYKWAEGNGVTYTQDQNDILYYLGTNTQGCDSFARLNLTIKLPQIRVDNVNTCVEYTWIDGNTYTNNNSTATYIVGTASNGCDSIAKLNLVISNILLGDDYVETCHPFTWIDGHTYYDSTSSVTFTTQSVHGCDSIITLHLTYNHINTNLLIVNGIPTVISADSTSYQWINCDTKQPISGATDTIFHPTQAGKYACVATYKQCSDTSLCYSYNISSINDLNQIRAFISVYPNPSNGEITIKVNEDFEWVNVDLFDVAGKQISNTQTIDKATHSLSLFNIPKGVYLLKIDTDKGQSMERIVVQ